MPIYLVRPICNPKDEPDINQITLNGKRSSAHKQAASPAHTRSFSPPLRFHPPGFPSCSPGTRGHGLCTNLSVTLPINFCIIHQLPQILTSAQPPAPPHPRCPPPAPITTLVLTKTQVAPLSTSPCSSYGIKYAQPSNPVKHQQGRTRHLEVAIS